MIAPRNAGLRDGRSFARWWVRCSICDSTVVSFSEQTFLDKAIVLDGERLVDKESAFKIMDFVEPNGSFWVGHIVRTRVHIARHLGQVNANAMLGALPLEGPGLEEVNGIQIVHTQCATFVLSNIIT